MLNALSTDLYELTMIGGYYVKGVSGRATFDLFVRQLPPTRTYLVAAGLEQALDFLESLRFTPEDIDFLRTVPALARLPRSFFDDYLPSFRFTGDVSAVEEGTPVFAHEPLLRVTAPLAEAQLVETALIAEVMFPTSVASRASRVVEAAAGRSVMEFGARRAHGIDAGIRAARAAYVAGFDATSIVEAGKRFGIPLSGTMAHSWVMASASEADAFRAYADVYREDAVLLIDTYDTVAAARMIAASGLRPRAVRLDSGDVAALSREVRRIFDEGGLRETAIVASGDLDELRIAEIVASGAPIDGFGVGTAISTSSDAPALSGVYKLAEIERDRQLVPVIKKSPGKRTYPGCKQVWRVIRDGVAAEDVLTLTDAAPPADAQPLLTEVMRKGARLSRPSLTAIRERCRQQVALLPRDVRRLIDGRNYRVTIRIES
ncbi:MAG: nicotinate phosphoribosyltransferase [Acidobacteria bacterium]|nr:MAG: nicotinate phosphoribosyltransferase [Acidobacteriota bacterium]PYR80868.1 MAG: nicotinate phosphoribosyltransferase [Acidobacteriota bacterium]